MIDMLNGLIGRAYTPLTDSGHAISTIAGVDFEWIACALIVITSIILILKFFIRIFIE